MTLKQLEEKKASIAVVGLGYVGLPLALALAHHFKVIGYDMNSQRIACMKQGKDPCNELPDEAFIGADISFSTDPDVLKEASFYIIAVPTPIDEHNQPDLTCLLGASKAVAKYLKKGDCVVYESTVYPGCTEEDCLPLLEQGSGLKVCSGFALGYSPERINPGDSQHTLRNTVKIVSACDEAALDLIAGVYGKVLDNPPFRASSIKVAEAAKIVENTQRDVNIALANELSIVFSRMGINTYEVLEAAGTKWNFLHFQPGLVGGHCIGVDPYYLAYKAAELGYHTQIISAGRFVNDSMGGYIAKKMVKQTLALGKNIRDAKVLVLGITFKENVTDVRNTKVVDIVRELEEYGVKVSVVDCNASPEEVKKYYGIESTREIPTGIKFDAIVMAVAHNEYKAFTENDFLALSALPAVFVDVKGIFRGRITKMKYWSL